MRNRWWLQTEAEQISQCYARGCRRPSLYTKLQNFKMMMARLGFVQGSRIKYNIRRDHLLEDAYEHIMRSEVKLLQMMWLNEKVLLSICEGSLSLP